MFIARSVGGMLKTFKGIIKKNVKHISKEPTGGLAPRSFYER